MASSLTSPSTCEAVILATSVSRRLGIVVTTRRPAPSSDVGAGQGICGPRHVSIAVSLRRAFETAEGLSLIRSTTSSAARIPTSGPARRRGLGAGRRVTKVVTSIRHLPTMAFVVPFAKMVHVAKDAARTTVARPTILVRQARRINEVGRREVVRTSIGLLEGASPRGLATATIHASPLSLTTSSCGSISPSVSSGLGLRRPGASSLRPAGLLLLVGSNEALTSRLSGPASSATA